MEKSKKQSVLEEPEIEFIGFAETDIITTSGEPWEGEDKEGELIPVYGYGTPNQ